MFLFPSFYFTLSFSIPFVFTFSYVSTFSSAQNRKLCEVVKTHPRQGEREPGTKWGRSFCRLHIPIRFKLRSYLQTRSYTQPQRDTEGLKEGRVHVLPRACYALIKKKKNPNYLVKGTFNLLNTIVQNI